MKFGAVYCLYDDHEYLETSVNSVKEHLDNILFLISDVPWNGKVSDNSKTIEFVKKLCKENRNFELMQGHWTNEIDQRNFGLQIFQSYNIDYTFIIDNDEIYHDHHFQNIINFIRQNQKFDAFHIEWNTYWSKDYYVIQPREYYQPLIAVRTSNYLFTIIRQGITSISRIGNTIIRKNSNEYNAALIPADIAICYHMSYARTNEVMQRKFETNSHAPEFIKNWYENVWLKWTPEKALEMRNLHPVTPSQYNVAIKDNFATFPDQLKLFIKNEHKNRLCSIIILNWNSCSLLKRCLSLVEDHTSHKNIKVIIVDNGSTKDDSIEYLKSLNTTSFKFPFAIVYNKENLGFAGGVNTGIRASDPKSNICLLNADAEVQKNWLDELENTINTNPSCGIAGSLGNNVASGYQSEGFVKVDTKAPIVMFYSTLIMREVINAIGFLDQRFGFGGYDDNDYCFRAAFAGYDSYLSAKSLVKHQPHQVFKLNGLDYLKDVDANNREVFNEKYLNILVNYSKFFNFYAIPEAAKQLGLIC